MDSLDTKSLLDAQKNKQGYGNDYEGLGVGIADEKTTEEILSAEATYGTAETVYGVAPKENPAPVYDEGLRETYSPLEKAKAEIPISILESMNRNPSGNPLSQNSYSGGYSSVPQQNTYSTPPQNSYSGRYSSSSQQNTYSASSQNSGSYGSFSSSTAGDTGSYIEENRILTRVNKIKSAVSSAETYLIISGFINTVLVLLIMLLGGSLDLESMGYDKFFVAFLCVPPLIILPLAFGVEKKKQGCAIAALVVASLDLLTSILGGANAISFIYKGGMVVSLAMSVKYIGEYHSLERQYANHPNYRIAELFDKSLAPKASGKHIAMIICIAISALMFVFCSASACSSVVSGISSGISAVTSEIDEWERYPIGEKNISVLMPSEPDIKSFDDAKTYYALNTQASVSVSYYPGFLDGYTAQEVDAILGIAVTDDWFTENGYVMQGESAGELSCGKYAEKIFYNEEDNLTVVVWVIARNDDINEIELYFNGTYEENKDVAEQYLSSIRGVY